MNKNIIVAGNTLIPALLALERLGFTVLIDRVDSDDYFTAKRGDESYGAEDPEALLGLVKLIEMRGWEWQVSDPEIEDAIERYKLG